MRFWRRKAPLFALIKGIPGVFARRAVLPEPDNFLGFPCLHDADDFILLLTPRSRQRPAAKAALSASECPGPENRPAPLIKAHKKIKRIT